MERMRKTVAQSRTEQIHILMPEHMNGYKRLFGGKVMEWIDIVAAVVARRHSGKNVTTVCVDSLLFKAAAHVNDTAVLVGEITHVGNSSMEVRVDTYVEELSGERKMVNTAYVVMVALDENERPTTVPLIEPLNEEEKLEWVAGERRDKLRRARRIENY